VGLGFCRISRSRRLSYGAGDASPPGLFLIAMAALSCTGLRIPPSLASSHVECTSRAAMEPCVGCRLTIRSTLLSSPDSWTPLGLGGSTGLNDLNCRRLSRRSRKDEKSRRRLEIVQQATLRVLERNPKPCATPFRSRSAFAIVQAALSNEQLEGGSRLNSVKDYNSALLSCVRYAIFCHFCMFSEN